MATIFTRRVIAYIIDFFVVSAFMWIVSYLIYFTMNPSNVHSVYQYFPIVVPILIMLYFVGCETINGATVGKALMYLQVKSRNGANINIVQAFVRNLSKIFWVPILFDWIFGKALGRDRLLAELTRTVVINELG